MTVIAHHKKIPINSTLFDTLFITVAAGTVARNITYEGPLLGLSQGTWLRFHFLF